MCWWRKYQCSSVKWYWEYKLHPRAGSCPCGVGQHKNRFIFCVFCSCHCCSLGGGVSLFSSFKFCSYFYFLLIDWLCERDWKKEGKISWKNIEDFQKWKEYDKCILYEKMLSQFLKKQASFHRAKTITESHNWSEYKEQLIVMCPAPVCTSIAPSDMEHRGKEGAKKIHATLP